MPITKTKAYNLLIQLRPPWAAFFEMGCTGC
ncbi:MAG: hypothetical protein HQ553_06865 [Chloroflexi bacterium]|nr:hypothetical protein [Chloroflexota bacterium]